MKTGNIVLLSALAVAGIGLLLLVVLVGAWWFLSDQPTAMAAGVPAATATNPPASPPPDFPSAVSYELGDSEFASGDSITITELRGTAEDIQPGGTYCVTGTYTLTSQDAADLSFFATTTNRTPTPVDPQQTVRVTKGTGSFRLIKHMAGDGYLHLTFYSRATGQGFGGVYFGQGQWVLRHKQWRYRDSASQPQKPERHEPVSATGPNQVLFEYLGNPVPAPANLDAAYTKAGLTQAMQTAAQNAGISLRKLEIDDSEFPFLVYVACADRADMEKLKQQIGALTAYNYTGGVGGNDRCAMNLVPGNAFPAEASLRIYHRLSLREQIFDNLVNATQ
jgi:hypothetical protein